MFKITLFLVICCSVAFGQLIIDENDEFGKKLIAKMMSAINVHEISHHEKLEFVTVVSTLGSDGKFVAYLALKNANGKQFSCTCELLEHGTDNYEVGRVICTNDNETTTHRSTEA